MTIVGAIIVVLESTLGWLLSVAARAIELLMAIPVVGAVLRTWLNLVTHAANTYLSSIDTGLGLIGIRPEKKLRVCTIILRDEKNTLTSSLPYVKDRLQLAANVFKRDANVRLVPNQAFKFTTGFLGAEKVDDSWLTVVRRHSPPELLDPRCNVEGFVSDFGLPGAVFQLEMSGYCPFNAWRRVLGYGAPVAIFIVRTVTSQDILNPANPKTTHGGCATWIVDFGTIPGDAVAGVAGLSAIAHELGHSCNLWHYCVDDDPRNLMADAGPCSTPPTKPINFNDPTMNDLQVLAFRASKHVTYF